MFFLREDLKYPPTTVGRITTQFKWYVCRRDLNRSTLPWVGFRTLRQCRFASDVNRGGCRLLDAMEPMPVLRLASGSGIKKYFLNFFGYWTTRLSADQFAIDFTNRCHLRGCACEESLVCRQKVFEMNRADVNGIAEIVCDPENCVARNAEQDG